MHSVGEILLVRLSCYAVWEEAWAVRFDLSGLLAREDDYSTRSRSKDLAGNVWCVLSSRAELFRSVHAVDFFAGANSLHPVRDGAATGCWFARPGLSLVCEVVLIRREAGVLRDRRTEAAPPILPKPPCEAARLRAARANGIHRPTAP